MGVGNPATDPRSVAYALTAVPDRELIAGVSGSGKTTLARLLATRGALQHGETGALYHGSNWAPRAEFLADVAEFAAQDRWVTERQHTSKGAGAMLEPRAQLPIWLGCSWLVARGRLIWRTLSRSIRVTEPWNGNREGLVWRLRTPAESEAWVARTPERRS